jgi:hypothetical protein
MSKCPCDDCPVNPDNGGDGRAVINDEFPCHWKCLAFEEWREDE